MGYNELAIMKKAIPPKKRLKVNSQHNLISCYTYHVFTNLSLKMLNALHSRLKHKQLRNISSFNVIVNMLMI